MTEKGLLRLRGAFGWLAALLCLCAALGLADSFLYSFRTGPNTFAILPGGTEHLSGPLPPEAADAASMRVTVDHPGVRLVMTTQSQGFWFGNRIWQAEVKAAPDAAPGTAAIVLRDPNADEKAPVQAFFIQVFPDQAALDAASGSYIRRLSGLQPLVAAAFCLGGAILAGCCVFLTSRRLEALWIRQGKAVVYMTKKTPDGLLISFGLGTNHGLSTGATVAVADESGLPVATASVVRCDAADASALVADKGTAALGNIVSRLSPPA
ncbi:hypothetical protein [Solidesulfovibrio sp.]|uniref:hypothetical protein n=1 Tax=Solidesulfovibrio sp. TaxID=2910990 RepID=UPI002635C655|nr:hypothetical protein [Solidesulfovibrio sp.]